MFIITGDKKFKQGVLLHRYKDVYSIVSARQRKDGVTMQWCQPQISTGRFADKTMPLGVRLGTVRAAIRVLKDFTEALEKELGEKVKSSNTVNPKDGTPAVEDEGFGW